MDLVLRSRRVVLPDGVRPASVAIEAGRITRIASWETDLPAVREVDLGELVLMPGLVDTHVHVNEPGRTDWEGFETATRAAAAGGVTTIVDMPLNSIPATTTVAGLEVKRQAAAPQCRVDVGFWGGAVGTNQADLAPLHDAGVMGFKCFLVESGVPEFPCVDAQALEEAMIAIAALDALLIVHAELPGPIEEATAAMPERDPRDYRSWLESRPKEAEDRAVELLVALSRKHGTRTHVVHLASAGALETLRAAREEGVPISAETCPHYLTLAAEEVPDGATEFKCAPPIRERANADRLWEALREGLIGTIVTDHSPSPPDLKHRDTGAFPCAWGGISSLQLGLPAVWTELVRRGGRLEDLARWMSAETARLVGLHHQKGRIAVGLDADLFAWDPDATARIGPEHLHHRHPLTPYAGRRLYGRIERTWLRGELIYDGAEFPGAPRGRLLRRTTGDA